VHVPLAGDARFPAVSALSQAIAAVLAERHPHELTTEFSKEERGDRLFVDVLRNAASQHAVAPYTLRPKPGAPVAVPLRWEEVDSSWRPQSTPLASLFRRLGSLSSDPWEGFDEARIEATVIARRRDALTA
jgi:bifunctional non-homologous end joining protein LigD